MSTLFNDGSHVHETFASAFKTLVNCLANDNEPVNFRLNKQNTYSAMLSCSHAYACEHITFINSLDSEILAYGVAIVVATDYRTDSHETTIFVVCDDDM